MIRKPRLVCIGLVLPALAALAQGAVLKPAEKRLSESPGASQPSFESPRRVQPSAPGPLQGNQLLTRRGTIIEVFDATDTTIRGAKYFTAMRWLGVGAVGSSSSSAAYAFDESLVMLTTREDWASSVARDMTPGSGRFVAVGDMLNRNRDRTFVLWRGGLVWVYEQDRWIDTRGNAVVRLGDREGSVYLAAAEQGSDALLFAFRDGMEDPFAFAKCKHGQNRKHVLNAGVSVDAASGPAGLFAGSSDGHAWLLAVNAQGDCFSSRVLDTKGGVTELKHISVVSDGFVVAGNITFSGQQTNIFLAKLSKSLQAVWSRVCGSKKGTGFISATSSEDGIFVVGHGSGIVWGSSPWLLHVSPNGSVIADGFAGLPAGEMLSSNVQFTGTRLASIAVDGTKIRERQIRYDSKPATLNFPESLASDSPFGDARLATKRALTCLDVLASGGGRMQSVRDDRFK